MQLIYRGGAQRPCPTWAEGGRLGLGAQGPNDLSGMGSQLGSGTTVQPQDMTMSSCEPGLLLRQLCSQRTRFVEWLSDLRPGAGSPEEVLEPLLRCRPSSGWGGGGVSTYGNTRPCLPGSPRTQRPRISSLPRSPSSLHSTAPVRAKMCRHGNCLANTPQAEAANSSSAPVGVRVGGRREQGRLAVRVTGGGGG